MYKILKNTLLSTILCSSLGADYIVANQNFNDEFKRVQNYVNDVIKSNIKDINFNGAYPNMNIQNLKESYIITFELAGMMKDEITLLLNSERVLTVEGERKYETVDKTESYTKKEMFFGKFKRSILLPEDADLNTDNLTTDYKNGILKLIVKKIKTTKVKSKIIPIN